MGPRTGDIEPDEYFRWARGGGYWCQIIPPPRSRSVLLQAPDRFERIPRHKHPKSTKTLKSYVKILKKGDSEPTDYEVHPYKWKSKGISNLIENFWLGHECHELWQREPNDLFGVITRHKVAPGYYQCPEQMTEPFKDGPFTNSPHDCDEASRDRYAKKYMSEEKYKKYLNNKKKRKKQKKSFHSEQD